MVQSLLPWHKFFFFNRSEHTQESKQGNDVSVTWALGQFICHFPKNVNILKQLVFNFFLILEKALAIYEDKG